MEIGGIRLFGGNEEFRQNDKVQGFKDPMETDFIFKLEPGAFGGKTNDGYHNQSVFISDWDA